MTTEPFNPQKARTKRPLPFWVDAFVRKTLHLDMSQIGAYVTILHAMWGRETCDLPASDNQIAALCRVSKTKWLRHFKPVLWGYFEVCDGMLISDRLQKEATFVEKTLAKQSTRKRGKKSDNTLKDIDRTSSTEPSPDETTVVSPDNPTQQPNNPTEEESKASSSTAAAAYERYLEAHPNRVESYEGELDFAGLVQSGVDPNQIIGAAQEYAKTVATWSDEAFVQQSDNFIHPERGKWRQYVQRAKPPPASMDDVMAFWAEKITAGKYVAPSAIKPDMARQMVAANLVSEDQLRQAGVRS